MPVLLQQLLSTQDVDNNKSVYYVYISNDKGQTVSKGAVYLSNHDRGLGIRVKNLRVKKLVLTGVMMNLILIVKR